MIITILKDKKLKTVIEGMFGKQNIFSFKDLTTSNLRVNPETSEVEMIITDGSPFASLANGKKNLDCINPIVSLGIPIFLILTNPKTKDSTLAKVKPYEEDLIIIESKIEKVSMHLEEAISNNINLYKGLQLQNPKVEEEKAKTKIDIDTTNTKPRKDKRRGSRKREVVEEVEDTSEVLGSNIENVEQKTTKDFEEVTVPEVSLPAQNLIQDLELESESISTEISKEVSPEETYLIEQDKIETKIQSSTSIENLLDKISELSYNVLNNKASSESKAYKMNKEAIQTLERDIIAISNMKMSPEEKFECIKKLIRAKLEYQVQNSDAITTSLLNIMNLIQNQASVLVTKNLAEKEASLARIKQTIINTSDNPEKHIIERQKLISSTYSMIQNLHKIVKTTEDLSYDVTTNILKGIPTNNPVINKNLEAISIVPSNFSDMVDSITKGMMEGSIAMSAIISPVETLMKNFINLIQVDNNMLTEYQTRLDKAFIQNPESMIVFNGPTKHLLRLIVGGSGKSSATVILHDICERRGETLTIDLTEDNITRSYNDNQQPLEESLGANKVLHNFLYIDNLEELNIDALISFLSVYSTKYRYINIVVEDNEIIDKLSEYALSVINIGINKLNNIQHMSNIADIIRDKVNVARRYVIVGDIIDDSIKTSIVNMLNIDNTKDAFLIIPNLSAIPSSEINKTKASYNPKVVEAYSMILD